MKLIDLSRVLVLCALPLAAACPKDDPVPDAASNPTIDAAGVDAAAGSVDAAGVDAATAAACANTADEAIVGSSNVPMTSDNCALSNIGDATATTTCVVEMTGLSAGCSGCFADASICALSECLAQCAADPSSQACADCKAAQCEPAFTDCSGL